MKRTLDYADVIAKTRAMVQDRQRKRSRRQIRGLRAVHDNKAGR